jgi:hypothetical protein
MTNQSSSSGEIQVNPLIAALLEKGAETGMMLQGYVGPSPNEGYLRLYPVLGNLRKTIDVARADILHSVESPRSGLGAIIVWVKKDAQLVISRVESSATTEAAPRRARYVDVNKGRLRMRVRSQWRGSDVCQSVCDTCTSQCTYHCDSDCEVPV